MNELPSLEYIRSVLDYDPETGIFKWKARVANCLHPGAIAGHIRDDGYRVIKFNHKALKAHRIAWLLTYGEWPKQDIDHINGIPGDNRICNLRDISHRMNGCNRKENREGKLAGASYHKKARKWAAQLKVKDKVIHLGLFPTMEEAHQAYMKAVSEA
jgi:hypothetical protein